MTSLAATLLAELDGRALDVLAGWLAPRLLARLERASAAAGWLDVTAAAEHLACPVSRVYAPLGGL